MALQAGHLPRNHAFPGPVSRKTCANTLQRTPGPRFRCPLTILGRSIFDRKTRFLDPWPAFVCSKSRKFAKSTTLRPQCKKNFWCETPLNPLRLPQNGFLGHFGSAENFHLGPLYNPSVPAGTLNFYSLDFCPLRHVLGCLGPGKFFSSKTAEDRKRNMMSAVSVSPFFPDFVR